jgi:hypothetical protein
VPAANTTRTVQSHCPLSSSTQCQRCCCIGVPYNVSHNLKVTDLNSTEQQWAPSSSSSVHTYLLGYLNSMKYIIVCMEYTPHCIYHFQLCTIGTLHLHPVTYPLIPCYVPNKTIHTMPYTIRIGIYSEARIGQTCIHHGIKHPDYGIYHGIYQKLVYSSIYHGNYHEATIGPGSRQLVYTMVYTMAYTCSYGIYLFF